MMGNAYPDVVKNRDFVTGVLAHEEERFRQTLKTGLGILEDELQDGRSELPGSTAFLLHDTYGFPLELTEEIAGERGVAVDGAGFDAEMKAQRERAKAARKGANAADHRTDEYRDVVEQFGITEFVGYNANECEARVLAVLDGDDDTVEVFLDRTPFYAEAGGQVGDTGTI
ncbi:MAG TPA: alanine--tRNA ligase, partial [Acidimicrobiaceae bacterium]|nr:alanine--tRNA ligase [Acidimicrobiaceae bacterium]